jgi:integrase
MNTSRDYLITVGNKKLLYTTARVELEKCMKSLGMEHYFHDTRHTCSTLMEEAGVPLLHRKLILGHKSSDITDRYTHVSRDVLITDINKI